MILERYLLPDGDFPSYAALTPDYLCGRGVRLLICDLDNTLAPYEDEDAPPDVIAWAERMRGAGIAVVLISNNDDARVARFSAALGVKTYAHAKKPSPRAIFLAIGEAGVTAGETALLGDQLLTDVAAARRAGVKAYLVPPIRDKKTLFFRAKRAIEKPYLKKYERLKAGKDPSCQT